MFPPQVPVARMVSLSFMLVLQFGSLTALSAPPTSSAIKPIFPKALKAGDTIEIVAPAGYLNADRIALARKRLESMGFKVRVPENVFRKQGYFAGSDDERAQELMHAFADPEVNAIFPGTGGYGTTRIVDRLDYDIIRRNPKVLTGFSDITGLHLAINQKTGLVTFHSPNPEWGLGSDQNLPPLAAKWFWRALLKDNYSRGPNDRLQIGFTIEISAADAASTEREIGAPVARPTTLRNGKSEGRLIGGNLSVVHALMGTPYEINTDGKLLFLEDIGEAPYRIDRMLNTLRLAGKFDHLRGVILGTFTARQGETKWDDDVGIDQVLSEYFARLGVPVISNFPSGHVFFNVTLPIGVLVELDANQRTLRLLEDPVTL